MFFAQKVVLEKQPHLDRDMVTPPPPIDDVTTEDKENSSSVRVLDQLKGEKPKKKSAMFADTVEVLSFSFVCPDIAYPKRLIFPRCETLIQVWWKQTT